MNTMKLLLLLFPLAVALDDDGVRLLSLRYSVVSDPSSALSSWDYSSATPCSWNGISCASVASASRVVALLLPDARIVGSLPADVFAIEHLRHLDLSGNSFSDHLPNTINSTDLRQVDLSGNQLTGEIPAAIAGLRNLTYLSLRGNHFVGRLPGGFPAAEHLDLSCNSINGPLPKGGFGGRGLRYLNLSGNNLSGEIPTNFAAGVAVIDLSSNPRLRRNSPPAFAAMPEGEPAGGRRLHPAAIAGIAVGLFVGLAVLLKAVSATWRKGQTRDTDGSEVAVEAPEGVVVTVDGGEEVDVETLLKASAYVLGASGGSIVYKAVLGDGRVFAVRRIGEESTAVKVKDFEAKIRAAAKLRHPNLVAIKGFYSGEEEKLLICEYVPNGSLVGLRYRKQCGSPYHMSWEIRMRIARGVARGLVYLHDKKAVHGNLKPSNILLGVDMEPKISDYGLDRLLLLRGSSRGLASESFHNFGSKRSTLSTGSLHEASPATASPYCTAPSTPYVAPEIYRSIKPNAKWDVYSFGVVLIELLVGRALSEAEIAAWSESWPAADDGRRAVRMVDAAMRGELDGREEAVASCLRLALSCASAVPQRRPAMKEVLQLLEKISSSHPT